MANLILMVERLRTSSSADNEGIRRFHEQRHQLIQEMVEKFDLDVTSWIDTHPDGRPREWDRRARHCGYSERHRHTDTNMDCTTTDFKGHYRDT
jgi:hypothetical protein